MSRALLLIAALLLCTASFAIGEDIAVSLNRLCVGVKGILPIAAMLMVVLGAVLYAAGQLMGAETRARANVWATAALTGAMMAILMAAITPAALNQIYGRQGEIFCEPPIADCVDGGGNFVCSGARPYCYRCSHIVNGGVGPGICGAAGFTAANHICYPV